MRQIICNQSTLKLRMYKDKNSFFCDKIFVKISLGIKIVLEIISEGIID